MGILGAAVLGARHPRCKSDGGVGVAAGILSLVARPRRGGRGGGNTRAGS
jgi:hypothetical protein